MTKNSPDRETVDDAPDGEEQTLVNPRSGVEYRVVEWIDEYARLERIDR